MINVEQLTSQLRMMPDAALQRMAQMYKQDPYIFPMVISEGMARKKLRMAGQAQGAQGAQPKVVDQAVMAMAPQPEAAPGIAALQARSLNIPDGGIAGYADGGDVVMSPGSTPSYQRIDMSPGMLDFAQHSEPVVRMAGGGVARYADEGLVQTRVNPYIEGILALDPDMDEQGLPRTRRESEMIRAKQKEALAKKKEAETYAGQLSATVPTEYRERMEQFYRPRRTPEQLAGGPVVTQPAPAAAPGAAPGVAPGAGAGAPSRVPSAGTGAAVPAGGGAAMPSVESAKRTAAEFFDAKAAEKQLADYQRGEAAAVEAARERRKKAMEGQGKAYEGLEALLKKEEEGAKGELEQSKAFAILNAGLAMMAGTSPRALENIGKGAMVGTGQYADAIKDFKKSAKERQRAMADIEQARRAEARADTEAQLKFEEKADEKMSNARKFGVEGLLSIGVKNADTARQIYTTQVEQQGATQRTAMQVNAPPAQLQAYKALGRAMGAKTDDEAIMAGFSLQTREQRIPALYDQYIARSNSQKLSMTGKGTEGEEFLKQYPTFETYLRGMGVQPGSTSAQPGGGFVTPPAGAPILR